MQKYDDFGRPIYETAEEYNRAHGRGGSSLTYNSPDENSNQYGTKKYSAPTQSATQRHAIRKESKKAKPLVLGIVVIALNIVIVSFAINMAGGSYEQAIPEPERDYANVIVENEDYYGEYLGAPDTPLSEGFENFTYNEVWVTLPTTYKEIATLGYELEGYKQTDIIPPDYWETISLLDEDGYTVAMISITNDTEDDIPLEECTVDYFYIDNPARYDETLDVPDFVFGDGLTLESSYEEVEAYFGTPYYHYEDRSDEDYLYDSYQWEYYGEKERHFVMVNFLNGEILDICIEKEVYEE